MEISRQDAWELLNKYVESDSLIKHSLAVEAAMRAYGQKFGKSEDEIEKWGITGLIHDFDYEKDPENHPTGGAEILREKGYPEDVVEAVLGHATYTGVERETEMAKTLFAVDELTGMVMATAYVRPTNFKGMSPRSVKKNLKKNNFAASINRQDIQDGIAELGVDKDEHIALVIEAMAGIAEELGFKEE